MRWWPLLLIGLGGFLIGGVLALWKDSRVPAVILALLSLGCLAGGVLWLIG